MSCGRGVLLKLMYLPNLLFQVIVAPSVVCGSNYLCRAAIVLDFYKIYILKKNCRQRI